MLSLARDVTVPELLAEVQHCYRRRPRWLSVADVVTLSPVSAVSVAALL